LAGECYAEVLKVFSLFRKGILVNFGIGFFSR